MHTKRTASYGCVVHSVRVRMRWNNDVRNDWEFSISHYRQVPWHRYRYLQQETTSQCGRDLLR